jgi:abequosyltransferase
MIKLSICIPTYNFGHTIGETLDSILINNLEGVEIVILDGGSTDNTKSEVEIRQHKFSRLIYHNQEFKGGIDKDIEKVVSFANGKFCWLFSADDIMIKGALNHILKELENDYEIYLCEQLVCDNNLDLIKEHPIFRTIRTPKTFDFLNSVDRALYFKNARTTEAFFSYLAGPIFKKTIWDSVNNLPTAFYKSCWCHAGRLLIALDQSKQSRISYLGKPFIKKRAGIDSFLNNGIVNRLAITIIEFSNIAYTVYGNDSFESFHMRRTIRNEESFRFRHLISLKIQFAVKGELENVIALNNLVKIHYSNAGMINKFKFYTFKYIPVLVLRFIKLIKDKTKTL